jgi:hypothetical protein
VDAGEGAGEKAEKEQKTAFMFPPPIKPLTEILKIDTH